MVVPPGGVQGSSVDPVDWVEIFNNGTTNISLANYTLSDNEFIPKKWVRDSKSLLPLLLDLPMIS